MTGSKRQDIEAWLLNTRESHERLFMAGSENGEVLARLRRCGL
jgi:hypothetical protein